MQSVYKQILPIHARLYSATDTPQGQTPCCVIEFDSAAGPEPEPETRRRSRQRQRLELTGMASETVRETRAAG